MNRPGNRSRSHAVTTAVSGFRAVWYFAWADRKDSGLRFRLVSPKPTSLKQLTKR